MKKATLITLAALVALAVLLLLLFTTGNATPTTWQTFEERLPAAVQSAGFRTIASQRADASQPFMSVIHL